MLDRRQFLSTAAGAVLSSSQGKAAATRPNLVHVFADQLGYHHCGYNGDEQARTPNIDKLAAQSLSFDKMVCSTPVCAPYRATLMTGKYQSSTGMVINELRLSPDH